MTRKLPALAVGRIANYVAARPVKTFVTAAIYYHKFRLCHRDAEYNYQDAALASLFVACKVEDTIKKSKEILCAAHNIKFPDHMLAQDDKVWLSPSSRNSCDSQKLKNDYSPSNALQSSS